MLREILIGGLGLGTIGEAEAADRFTSGPMQVALLELFSSEGCSSCPPAEKWFGEQRDDPGLWKEFVPIAFHVTYWDMLGWPDKFARREYTDRQYAYSHSWGARSVYTPAFVRNGLEWRPGQLSGDPATTGVLTVDRVGNAVWHISFFPAGKSTKSSAFEIQMAVLGGDIASQVRRGENAGRILRHEFVALGLKRSDLAPAASGRFATEIELEIPLIEGVSRLAIAAWVTARGESEPLQAVGGWLE